MKPSRIGLMFVVVVILSYGWQAKPSEASDDACHRPELLFSYLDIDRYNKSYPYVDYMAVVNPVLNHMLERVSWVSDNTADLSMYWGQICRAKDPEKEIAAWRALAYELNQRMHTDESVYKIVKKLFSDEMVAWVMNPPNTPIYSVLDPDYLSCQLPAIFVKHCGLVSAGYAMKHVDIFEAMCSLGVKEQEFEEAASESCKGNVYVLKPAWE